MPPFYTYISAGGAPPFNFGNALTLDGVNDYVAIPNYPITATSWSIGMWFYPTTGTGTANYLFTFSSGQASGVYIDTSANTLRFLRNNTSAVSTSIVIPLNEWNFLGWSKNGNTKDFHVYNATNGYSFATMTNTDFAINLISIGSLGASLHFSPYRFDETAVWNDLVLAKSDFDLMWNGGAGADLNTVLGTQPNLHYAFNETSGTSVPNDGATSGFNGTVNNSPTPTWSAH